MGKKKRIESLTWKQYVDGNVKIKDASHIALIQYIDYCRAKHLKCIDRERVAKRLIEIKRDIDGAFIDLYRDFRSEIE